MSELQPYKFHLIFKGLFRCVPDNVNNRLSVLLADARSPKASVVTGEPLQDHRAALEFRLDDWRNKEDWRRNSPEALPKFVEVTKHNKGSVGIYLLQRQDVRVGVTTGELSPNLTFIEDGSETSFSRLPQMADISPDSALVHPDALGDSGTNCIARILGLDRGEVRSERESRFGGIPLQWAYSLPRRRTEIEELRKPETQTPEKTQLRQELTTTGKPINLDLRITATVPGDAFVIINPDRIPNAGFSIDPAPFMLRPQREGQDLEVWIKNRELDVILTESDQPGSEEGCRELVDFDFALQYQLSATVQNVRIPYRSVTLEDNPVVLGGCACGGCS